MIDLGLTKIALIGAVALIVIGPEKLPGVARMAGTLFGRAQRYINGVKAEVNREMHMDELRKMQEDIRETATDINKTVAGQFAEAGDSLHEAMGEANNIYDGWTGEPVTSTLSDKSRSFRKKKVARTSSLPTWFKRQGGHRSHVVSGAARVARFRPSAGKSAKFFH